MNNLYITILACLTIASISFGQDTNSVSHISDNLGNTESSRAIYKGTLLTSLSIEYNELKYQGLYSTSSNKTIGAPVISIGYGVFKFMDFSVSYGLNYQESNFPQDGIFLSNYPYLNTFEIGTKINLFKQKGWVPELSYSLDYVSDIHLQRVTNTLAFSYNWGEKFRLGGNFGLPLYDLEKFEPARKWYYSLNVRYEFFEGFGAFADVKSQDLMRWGMNTQIGFYYRLNNNMQFHLHGGKVFFVESNNRFDIYFASGGFSWMLFEGH